MVSFKKHIERIAALNGPAARSRGRAIKAFAENMGFVYFGSVNTKKDDEIIRGLTVSPTHQDSHYSVGAYEDYDVALVDRLDVVTDVSSNETRHQWLIMETKLKQPLEPHLFIHPRGQDGFTHLFSAISHLPQAVSLNYSSSFTDHYDIYLRPDDLIELETIVSDETARVIAAHFWPFAIELYNGSLYLYSLHKDITERLLDTMIKNSVWLAQTLDASSEIE